MKLINDWDNLRAYGIFTLTTEPDGLRYRIVCDVTEKGKRLIERALGVIEARLDKNWDYGTNEEPHVGCIMLTPEILATIGIYALLEDGCHEVWTTRSHGLIGIQHGDSNQIVEQLQQCFGFDVVARFYCLDPFGKRDTSFLT